MLFVCPGSGTPRPASLDIEQATGWFDYIYIHWPDGTNTPPDYPMMYDRSLLHHSGRGVNLLTVGDLLIAKGDRRLWDEGAKRLKDFARQHPELDIPMPVGLRVADLRAERERLGREDRKELCRTGSRGIQPNRTN